MVDKLRPGRGGVDFTDEAVKRQALKHVHNNSEEDVSQTPFLSASYSFSAVKAMKAQAVTSRNSSKLPDLVDFNPHIVMIDIMANTLIIMSFSIFKASETPSVPHCNSLLVCSRRKLCS